MTGPCFPFPSFIYKIFSVVGVTRIKKWTCCLPASGSQAGLMWTWEPRGPLPRPSLAAVTALPGWRCHLDARMGRQLLPGPFGMLAECNRGPRALVAVSWGPPLGPGGCGRPNAVHTGQVTSSGLPLSGYRVWCVTLKKGDIFISHFEKHLLPNRA